MRLKLITDDWFLNTKINSKYEKKLIDSYAGDVELFDKVVLKLLRDLKPLVNKYKNESYITNNTVCSHLKLKVFWRKYVCFAKAYATVGTTKNRLSTIKKREGGLTTIKLNFLFKFFSVKTEFIHPNVKDSTTPFKKCLSVYKTKDLQAVIDKYLPKEN